MMFGKTFRVSIPGSWQDAWLYMDALLAWDRDNQLHRLPIEQLQKMMDDSVGPELGPLFELALFRNEWKRGGQFRRWVSMPSTFKAISGALQSNFPEQDAVLSVTPDFEQLPIEATPGTILDTEVYWNRVYVGSTKGAYETGYDKDNPGQPRPVVELSDSRTSALKAKYSVLNVSSGSDGLWFKRLRTNPSDHNLTLPGLSDDELTHVTGLSNATSFAGHSVLNYDGEPTPALLRTRGRTEGARDSQNSHYVVDGYEPPERLDQMARSAFRGAQLSLEHALFGGEDIAEGLEVLGNSDNRLLVAVGDAVKILELKAPRKTRAQTVMADGQRFGSVTRRLPRDEILSTHQFGVDFVLEYFDEVVLLAPDGVSRLYDGQVASLRSFADSRRYKEIVVCVTETSLELIGTL